MYVKKAHNLRDIHLKLHLSVGTTVKIHSAVVCKYYTVCWWLVAVWVVSSGLSGVTGSTSGLFPCCRGTGGDSSSGSSRLIGL